MAKPEQVESKQQQKEEAQSETSTTLANEALEQAIALRSAQGQSTRLGDASASQYGVDSDDLFDTLGSTKNLRGFGAAATLISSGTSGFAREAANCRDLNYLKNNVYKSWDDVAVSSVRYELEHGSRATSLMSAESSVLSQIKTRGAIRGVGVAALALGGTMATDAYFFSETPRTGLSTVIDAVGLPAIGYAPMNSWAKGASMVGLHAVGRVADHYYSKEKD